MPPEVPALEVRDVWVRFGGVQALQAVSMTVPRGTVIGLIGPNGAGKTTLFNVLSGLQRPERGRVVLAGRDVTALGPHRRARLGLGRTFQRLELFWSLSVADNVRVSAESGVQWWRWAAVRRLLRRGLDIRPGGPGAPALTDASVHSLLDRVGLSGLAGERVDALPTGQARLVELARALAIGPTVLLLDEPGSGLDDAESATLGQLLLELAGEGMAIVLVEHDMDLLMRVCHLVYVLDSGQVLAAGTPAQIRADPRVQAAYLGTPALSVPAAGAVPAMPSTTVVPGAVAATPPTAAVPGPAGEGGGATGVGPPASPSTARPAAVRIPPPPPPPPSVPSVRSVPSVQPLPHAPGRPTVVPPPPPPVPPMPPTSPAAGSLPPVAPALQPPPPPPPPVPPMPPMPPTPPTARGAAPSAPTPAGAPASSERRP